MTSPGAGSQFHQTTQETVGVAHRRLARDRVLWLAFGLGVAACLVVYFHLPYVNGPKGPKQWLWPYMHRGIFMQSLLGAMWRLALGSLVLGGAAWMIRRWIRSEAKRQWLGLLALFLWGVFFVWTSVTAATPGGLARVARIVRSPTWTSYFTLARWIRDGRQPPLAETLERYAELIPDFPLHARTHPPGLALASYGLLCLFEDHPALSTTLGGLYGLLGADPVSVGAERFTTDDVTAISLASLAVIIGQLGVFPFFWLVHRSMREACGSQNKDFAVRTAWAASILWAHYPALVLMLPAFDLIYPTVTLLCMVFAARGLNSRPVAWGLALGLMFMAGIFLTFPLLLLVPALCLMALLELVRRAGSLQPKAVLEQAALRSPDGHRFWFLISTTVATCLAVEIVLRLVLKIHLMRIFFAAVRHQNTVELAKLDRTFRIWVFYNLWDFLLFAGLALSFLALAWYVRSFRNWLLRPGTLVPAVAMFPLIILIVDLSHQLSAETARVWLFLAPGVAWAGAAELVHRTGENWRWVLAVLLVLQTLFVYVCRTNMMLWGF